MSLQFPLPIMAEADAKRLQDYYNNLGLTGITSVVYQFPVFMTFYLPDNRISDYQAANDEKKQDMIDIFLVARRNQSDTIDFSTAYNTEYANRYP